MIVHRRNVIVKREPEEGKPLPKAVIRKGSDSNNMKKVSDIPPVTNFITKEDFNRMGYKKRLELKNDYPEEYERLTRC